MAEKGDFFGELDEQMMGAAPGLSEKLEKLNRQQLGRAIVIQGEQRDQGELSKINTLITRTESVLQGKVADQDSDKGQSPDASKDYFMGYTLPVQSDQEKHLIILKSGRIIVMAPPGDEYREHNKIEYREKFAPNDAPLVLGKGWGTTINEIEDNYFKTGMNGTIILSNKKPNDLPQIAEAIDKSLILARELKGARDKAKQESVQGLMGKLDSFFGNEQPKGPSTNQAPPLAPPPSPSGAGPSL